MVVERPRLAEEVVAAAVNVAAVVVLVVVAPPKLKAGAVEVALLVGAAIVDVWVVAPKDKVGTDVVATPTLVPSKDCVEAGIALVALPKPNPVDAAVVGAAVVPKLRALTVVVLANGAAVFVAAAAELPKPKENPVVEAGAPSAAVVAGAPDAPVGADGLNEKLLVVVAGAGVVPKENPDEVV